MKQSVADGALYKNLKTRLFSALGSIKVITTTPGVGFKRFTRVYVSILFIGCSGPARETLTDYVCQELRTPQLKSLSYLTPQLNHSSNAARPTSYDASSETRKYPSSIKYENSRPFERAPPPNSRKSLAQ